MHLKYATTMAAYNRWMNERLYATCAELSDEERKLDRGAFFSSVHGTLNHLLLADKVWMGRFTSKPFKPTSLDQELYSVCVTHFFNHQTHHRGQLTTLLSQIGKDYGVTDLMWLPGIRPDS